jgi:hypothetical protein
MRVNCIGNVWSGSSEIDKTTNILKRKTIRGLQGKIKLHRGGGSLSVDETSVGQVNTNGSQIHIGKARGQLGPRLLVGIEMQWLSPYNTLTLLGKGPLLFYLL